MTFNGTLKGNISKTTRAASTYKKNPSIKSNAVLAAAYYAKKHNEAMIVIPGNSYGSKVYHIATEDKDLSFYTGPGFESSYAVKVESNGDYYEGEAAK